MNLIFLISLIVHTGISTRISFHINKNKSEIFCSNLESPRHGKLSCLYQGSKISCHEEIPPDTIADYECDDYFIADSSRILKCLRNGTWDSRIPKCVPDCGKQNSVIALIMNGDVAIPGTYPWQVAIYNFLDGKYEFWCGGSLISEFSVVTAAHCIWKIPEGNLIAVVGKFHRDINIYEENIQKRRVIRVEMLQSYQDVLGNYNGDLSVLFLERAVTFNAVVRPICIDWKQELMEEQLVDGNLGIALGWGLTVNGTFSDFLRYVPLPVKSDVNCIAHQQKDFRKFITYTSFCAGSGNGSSVCNGDSGGGLAFRDNKSDTWYLQGVISVSPRKKESFVCDPKYFTIFTKVTIFVKWLLKVREVEEGLVSSGVIADEDYVSEWNFN